MKKKDVKSHCMYMLRIYALKICLGSVGRTDTFSVPVRERWETIYNAWV